MRGTKFPTDPDNIEEGCCDICKFWSFNVDRWSKGDSRADEDNIEVCETCIEEFEQQEEIKLEFFGTLSPEQFTKLKQFTPMEINNEN